MSTFDNINDALKAYENSMPSEPLLNESEIKSLIQANPIDAPQSTPKNPRFGTTTLLVGFAAAAAVAIAYFTSIEPTIEPEIDDVAMTQKSMAPASQSEDNERIMSLDLAVVQKEVTGTPIRTLDVKPEDLQNIGLTLTGSTLTYNDQALNIVVSTNGISAKKSSGSPSKYTPRHISIYQGSELFASWFDAARKIEVNELVPIRVRLEDPDSQVFPIGDVVLWYEPTEEFLDRLPGDLRKSVSSTETPLATSNISWSKVFPNPVHGSSATLQFMMRSAQTSSAVLVDMSGKTVQQLWDATVFSQGQQDFAIQDLDVLPNGMYMVIITVLSSDERIIQRLLIER